MSRGSVLTRKDFIRLSSQLKALIGIMQKDSKIAAPRKKDNFQGRRICGHGAFEAAQILKVSVHKHIDISTYFLISPISNI